MPQERQHLMWKGHVVGYVDQFDNDSSFGPGWINTKLYARWHPIDSDQTRAFLEMVAKEHDAEVELDGTTYHVYDKPAQEIKLQCADRLIDLMERHAKPD